MLLVSAMAVQGVKNVQSQLNIHGEYSNPEQETLFEWIIANTAEGLCSCLVYAFYVLR